MNPFRYGLFGVGRCGCVHGQILLSQGQKIVAIGDENSAACVTAANSFGLKNVATFNEPSSMATNQNFDAVVIASHTKDHGRHAAPFIRAGIPVYLEKPLTADLS